MLFSATPISAKWDEWDYPGADECLSDYVFDSYSSFWLVGINHDWNSTALEYVYDPGRSMTLEECQAACENNDYCTGIIVDEYLPGACWHTSTDHETIWNNISPEIGNCNSGPSAYCRSCNNTYLLHYWNLTERAGKIL